MPIFDVPNPEALKKLKGRVSAKGGPMILWQNLQRGLAVDDRSILVEEADVPRIIAYASGRGGWQDIFRPFVPQAQEWVDKQPKQGSFL